MKQPVDVYKRRWTLAAVAICPKCGHLGDVVTVMPSGPHYKACCLKCGAYIKFLSKAEGVAMRKPTEDRDAQTRTVFIGWAEKDNTVLLVKSSANRSVVEKEIARVKNCRTGIDEVKPDPYAAPLNAKSRGLR